MPLIETVAVTGSTNDDLLARAAAGAPEGLWLRAERQTGGKGRQGRMWLSPLGNLYASTLVQVRPGDPAVPTLALVAAVALHEVVAAYAPVQIKWPNDLLADGAKLAGILLERAGDAVVIGFGVNLVDAPEVPGRAVTSLAVLTGKAPDADMIAQSLAASFARRLATWRTGGLAQIRAAWLAAAHPIGTPLRTGASHGVFDGLDESGALLLRLRDGMVRTIHAGDVFLV